jgi:hypothetical protein
MNKSLTNEPISGIMSEEEWAEVQGMTYSEFRSGTDFEAFYKDADEKRKSEENGNI